MDKIIRTWCLKYGDMVPKNKAARKLLASSLADFYVSNKYGDAAIFFTKTEEFYSEIFISLSCDPSRVGVFHVLTSPRKKQAPVDLMKKFAPFLIDTFDLPCIDAAAITCVDIAADVSAKIHKYNLAQPLYFSNSGKVEDCYVAIVPGSKLFIFKDEILNNETLMKDTITYLSCSFFRRIFLGQWKRPWRRGT